MENKLQTDLKEVVCTTDYYFFVLGKAAVRARVAVVIRAYVVKVEAVKVAEARAVATNPALAPQATVSAQVVDTKNRMWPASAALIAPVQNVGRR
jgi:hypothetical protein